jgi:competence protein ComEA
MDDPRRTPVAGIGAAVVMGLIVAPAAWTSLQGTPRPVEDGPAESAPIKLDLNRATAEELLRVPQLGKSTVERIIRGRPYRSVDDLTRVGVSARTIESLREIVVVGPPSAPGPRVARRPVVSGDGGADRIDLNSADVATLQALPGVGPTLARAIVEGRPYDSFEDLGRVRGLTPSKFAAFRDRVTIEPPPRVAPPESEGAAATTIAAASTPSRIDLNTASLEQLESLPSIGPAKARAIVEHRPYRTIEDVMRVPGIKQGTFDRIKGRISVGAGMP